MGSIGKAPDGIGTHPADEEDLDSYARARKALDELHAPLLLHADNPHERLYISAQDGTGNDLFSDPPERQSLAATIHVQVRDLKSANVASGYVKGIYTQDSPLKSIPDGINGYTFERRVETAYHQFCGQAKEWLEEDPQAQIRVVSIGFSRGAEQAAALARMIHERGIQDPDGARIIRDSEDLITHAEYTKPPLVAPGQTIQAALLLDPVATGIKEHDRRLPPSVMSVLQVTSEDERRDQFKASDHIVHGFSEENRALHVIVGGAHSDIGNTYALNGLGTLSHNLAVDYLNRLSDTPFLQQRPLPEDPDIYRVHRSDQHAFFYTTRGYDKDGLRDHVTDLGPSAQCRAGRVAPCDSKEPMDPELERLLERRTGPQPAAPAQEAPDPAPGKTARVPGSDVDRMIDRLYTAAVSGSDAAWRETTQAVGGQYLASPQGQAWQRDVQAYGDQQRLQEQQEALQAQLAAQQQDSAHRPHAMRL